MSSPGDLRDPIPSPDLMREGSIFRERLRSQKNRIAIPDYGWYPYDSLALLPEFLELLRDDLPEIWDLAMQQGVLDLGCGDGDLAAFFASQGISADAVDHAPSNYNQMRGVRALEPLFHPLLRAYDTNIDSYFELPRPHYGFIAFLGTLYHLKNPFLVLEKLATAGCYCLLSTRIAQLTANSGLRIESEPLAYLLDPREINDDSTNFWTFSETCLLRLLHRSGWSVRKSVRIGCLKDSNPTDPLADERIVFLLRSRIRFPELHVRPLDGWHEIENDAWRWTDRHFSLEATLPEEPPAREFALKLIAPEAVLSAGQIVIHCHVGAIPAGKLTCCEPGEIELRGTFPERNNRGERLKLEFAVDSGFSPQGDLRNLGIVVPLLDATHASTQRLPFRIS